MRSLQKEEKKITPSKSGGVKQKSPLETKKILLPTGMKSVEKKRERLSPKQGGVSSVKVLQARSASTTSDAGQSNKLLSVFEKESLLESGPCTPALHLDGHKDVLSASVSVQEDKENVANRIGVCE